MVESGIHMAGHSSSAAKGDAVPHAARVGRAYQLAFSWEGVNADARVFPREQGGFVAKESLKDFNQQLNTSNPSILPLLLIW